jgi:DNA-binding transcriptional ArsR family regulator
VSDHDHPVNPDRVAKVRREDPGTSESQSVASLLTLLADPLRARILSGLLVVDELCVGDLALALDATEDAVTYALRILRTAGLVRRRREGRMGYYRLSDGPARSALAATLAATRDLVKLHPELGAEDEQ